MLIRIPGPIPSKKNSKKIIQVRGRPMIISSSNHARWLKSAKEYMIGVKAFSGPIGHIQITLFWADNRRRDLTNSAESVMDLLVECGIIPDDCWQFVPAVSLLNGGVDKKWPRAEVVINQ